MAIWQTGEAAPFRIGVIAALGACVLGPVLLIVYQSFLTGPFFDAASTIGLASYAFIFSDPEFYRALAEGRTLLLISHRFSTVRMADRILVLDAAQVIENGTHDELMRLGGRYAVLYDLHRRHLGVT